MVRVNSAFFTHRERLRQSTVGGVHHEAAKLALPVPLSPAWVLPQLEHRGFLLVLGLRWIGGSPLVQSHLRDSTVTFLPRSEAGAVLSQGGRAPGSFRKHRRCSGAEGWGTIEPGSPQQFQQRFERAAMNFNTLR